MRMCKTIMGCVRQKVCVAGAVAVCLLGAAALTGCAEQKPGPYQTLTEADRNPLEAQRLTREAADLMVTDPEGAERLLRQALTADLFHGPAHNNLGVLMLRSEPARLYEAAQEFEWASKLMPGHPDPRTNLALAMECAGRHDDAIAGYRSALEVYPGYIHAAQALTSLQLRAGKNDPDLDERLREIALRGSTPKWREWAKAQVLSRASTSVSP